MYWRRLVKNIGWANQNIGGKGGKRWKMHGRFSIIGGTCPGCPPKSTPMVEWKVRKCIFYHLIDISCGSECGKSGNESSCIQSACRRDAFVFDLVVTYSQRFYLRLMGLDGPDALVKVVRCEASRAAEWLKLVFWKGN